MLVAKVQMIVHEVCEVQLGVVVALSEATTSLLFASRSVMPLANVDVAMPLPLKVNFKVFKRTDPALLAEKVIVAKLSTEDFVRFVVLPCAVADGVSNVRRTVIVLPVAPPVTVETMFELAPKAVTEEDAIWKVEVVLSTCELDSELYVGTSPFSVTVMAFACGMTNGVAKWNLYEKPPVVVAALPEVPSTVEPL